MNYAFDEFKPLAFSLPVPSSLEDPTLWYVSALIAELCYAQVPQFEIDEKRRLAIVPCDAYQEIRLAGTATNLIAYFEDADFDLIFVIILRNVIVVGLQIGNRLFIGFRGTLFFSASDWKINFQTSFYPLGPKCGRYHFGFSDEAFRVAHYILRQVEKSRKPIQEVVFSGHSLGGAVAAICGFLFSNHYYMPVFGPPEHMRIVMVAAPRYCDRAAYNAQRAGPYPVQLRRTGDMVPTVPPRIFGYADSPLEFSTSGHLLSTRHLQIAYTFWRWALFLGSGFAAHKIERYRRELGPGARAKLYSQRLLNPERLKASSERGLKGVVTWRDE
jgi:hypothetical protein